MVAQQYCIYNSSSVFWHNINSDLFHGFQAEFCRLTKEMLNKFGCTNMIANLGHGMYPDMMPEYVENLVEVIHQYSDEVNTQFK